MTTGALGAPEPEGFFTTTGPATAPAGTTTRIRSGLTTVTSAAGTPPKVTSRGTMKWAPVRVSLEPVTSSWTGRGSSTGTGSTSTWKGFGAWAGPSGVSTLRVTGPGPIPAGTVAFRLVSEAAGSNGAKASPNRTSLAPRNPVPVKVTAVPGRPEPGLKSSSLAWRGGSGVGTGTGKGPPGAGLGPPPWPSPPPPPPPPQARASAASSASRGRRVRRQEFEFSKATAILTPYYFCCSREIRSAFRRFAGIRNRPSHPGTSRRSRASQPHLARSRP